MKTTRLSRHLNRYLLPSLLGCAIGVAALPASAQSNAKAAGYYEDALVRFEKKDMPGTIIQLKNALQIDPNMLPVQLLLGKALMQNGEFPAAEVALNEALRLGVNRAEVVLQLGSALVAQGKHPTLLKENTFAPTGLPQGIQLRVLLMRASAQAEMGEAVAAMRSVDEARALDRNNADVWLAEVPIRIRARQYKEAMAAADTALSLAPNSAQALYQKGAVAHVQGDLRAAIAAYDRTLVVDARHVEARVARIGIALDQGRYDDAKKDVAELQKSAPQEPRGAYMKSIMAEREGDMDAARIALKGVTELLDPVPIEFIRYRPQLLMLNGLAHFGQGQGEKAKRYLEAFQRVQPASPVSKLLARIYLGDGNPAQAISVLEGYLRVQPGDGQAIELMARSHLAAGRNSKATALMQEALKTQDNPAFRSTLGLSLIGDGQTVNGITELEAAFKKDPRQLQAAAALVQLYLRAGQSKKALPVAEQLVKRQSQNAYFQNLLGMALGQAGNTSASRSAFEKAIALDPGLRQAALNLARLEISGGSYESAASRLTKLLEGDPKSGEAMFDLALIADRKGQQADAQRWLEKARDSGASTDVRWDLALVDFHLRYGRTIPAFDAAKLASSKRPEDVRTLMAYARAALAAGDSIAAKTALGSATRFAEYDAPSQVEIAALQVAAKNLAGAAYSLDKALSSRPDYLPAQALMTEVDLRQGETSKAEKRARDIIAQHPRLSIGQSLLGDVAMVRNQTQAAIEAYRRAHQIQPNSQSLIRLYGALVNQDGGKPAIELAEQWLKTHPDDLSVHKALANGHARFGNYPAAKVAYEAALKLRPTDAEVLNNLANVQIQLKDPAAIKSAETALANAPGNALLTDTLGWALFVNGQNDRALQVLRDARLRLPGNPDIRYHLAMVLSESGRKVEAREEVDAALKLNVAFENEAAAKKLQLSLR